MNTKERMQLCREVWENADELIVDMMFADHNLTIDEAVSILYTDSVDPYEALERFVDSDGIEY